MLLLQYMPANTLRLINMPGYLPLRPDLQQSFPYTSLAKFIIVTITDKDTQNKTPRYL